MALVGSLDTNVILRLLLNDIPEQHEAAKMIFDVADGQLAVADIAIVEIVFVLERHYGLTRKQIAEAIEGIMGIPRISCNRLLFNTALPLFTQNTSLSFEDCCLSMYAEINNALPLWTFDQKLAKQAPNAKLIL